MSGLIKNIFNLSNQLNDLTPIIFLCALLKKALRCMCLCLLVPIWIRLSKILLCLHKAVKNPALLFSCKHVGYQGSLVNRLNKITSLILFAADCFISKYTLVTFF